MRTVTRCRMCGKPIERGTRARISIGNEIPTKVTVADGRATVESYTVKNKSATICRQCADKMAMGLFE